MVADRRRGFAFDAASAAALGGRRCTADLERVTCIAAGVATFAFDGLPCAAGVATLAFDGPFCAAGVAILIFACSSGAAVGANVACDVLCAADVASFRGH